MSTQSNVENILRNIHVLLSKSEKYALDETKVVVKRQEMLNLLDQLNKCMYNMMEEYEVTKQSRDKAEREFQKRGNEIISDANKKAEDIYAASVMYTDEALSHVNSIVEESDQAIKKIYNDMSQKIKEQEKLIRKNQLELKSQLQDLIDTDKYLKLIEDRNKEIAKEKEENEEELKKVSIYANRKTEIKINQEYFEKMGIALEEEAERETQEYKKDIAEAEIKVDFNADYFKWKEGQDLGKKNNIPKDKSEKFQDILKNLNLTRK
uniref:hypothetical protein n=1 Tax=Agathobacter sp. TaxID=2021311 RepID=UPI004056A7DD